MLLSGKFEERRQFATHGVSDDLEMVAVVVRVKTVSDVVVHLVVVPLPPLVAERVVPEPLPNNQRRNITICFVIGMLLTNLRHVTAFARHVVSGNGNRRTLNKMSPGSGSRSISKRHRRVRLQHMMPACT